MMPACRCKNLSLSATRFAHSDSIFFFALYEERTMPTLKVEMYEGRTIEQKRAFAEKVTALVSETLGGAPEAV